MNVVRNIPTAENAKAIIVAAGSASRAHHDWTVPASQATSRNAAE